MKILQIDDNFSIIDSFSPLIEFLGHDFEYALDGQEGLRMISENNYDLILLDLTMPKFSGIDVLKKLKENNIPTKVILVTAVEITETQMKEFDSLNVSMVLHKPVTLNKIKETLSKFEQNEIAVNK